MVAGNPSAYDRYPFAAAHETCFGPELPFTLIGQQTGVQVDCQRKAFSIRTDLRFAERQYRGGNIGKPQHGPGLDGAERIQNSLFYRHGADHIFLVALFDEEFDFTGFSTFLNLFENIFHF